MSPALGIEYPWASRARGAGLLWVWRARPRMDLTVRHGPGGGAAPALGRRASAPGRLARPTGGAPGCGPR